MNLAKCGIDILVGYFGLAKGGNLNISVKEIVKGMWNGFDFIFFLDRIYRIDGIVFAFGEEPFGRRPHYPNDPVDPVQLYSLK